MGAETPTRAKIIAARSSRLPRRIAEMTPMGIPMTSQRRAAPMVRAIVTGNRPRICSFTEVWFR
ncbi:MAG: hypothetical protein KatS3mg014_2351 [Actinomycetota bacterium]|nr:MAG: hypothetical protein KatS3mg014_2351 [Actinomycetota bacterium]